MESTSRNPNRIRQAVAFRKHKIKEVKPGSIGEEMEIEAGDFLLAVNGEEIEDIFDYQFLIEEEYVVLLIRKASGEEWELEIEKDYTEDIGLVFENNTIPAITSACSVLLTRCQRECGKLCILRMMIPGFPFCREITLRLPICRKRISTGSFGSIWHRSIYPCIRPIRSCVVRC